MGACELQGRPSRNARVHWQRVIAYLPGDPWPQSQFVLTQTGNLLCAVWAAGVDLLHLLEDAVVVGGGVGAAAGVQVAQGVVLAGGGCGRLELQANNTVESA